MEKLSPDSSRSTFLVTPEVVGEYANAIGTVWMGDPLDVPPTLASVFTYAAVAAMPVKTGVVLTGQEFDFHHPIHVGDELLTSFAVTDRFERRDRAFMVITTETRNQDERLIAIGRITRMLPTQEVAS